jgi:hypothetical protein
MLTITILLLVFVLMMFFNLLLKTLEVWCESSDELLIIILVWDIHIVFEFTNATGDKFDEVARGEDTDFLFLLICFYSG